MGVDIASLLAGAGPAVIGAYLLIDRVFRFVNTRNGRNPESNLAKLVAAKDRLFDQNEQQIQQNREILLELRALRLELSHSSTIHGTLRPMRGGSDEA